MVHRGVSIKNIAPHCWRVRIEYQHGNFETTASTFAKAFDELSRCIAEDMLEELRDYQDIKEEII